MALLALLTVAAATARGEEPMRRLGGSVPRGLARMARAGTAPGDLPLERVTVFLGLRHRDGLDAVIAAQQDPRSPRFGRWLDAGEIADRFGPSRAEYDRVRRWLRRRGFRIVRDSPHRTLLVVAGTAAAAAAAFDAPIGLFRHRGRLYRGPLREPAVPESLASSVRGIFGLDDVPAMRPLVDLPPGTLGCFDGEPCQALAPADFAAAYGVSPLLAAGFTGAGRSVAVIARTNYPDSDIALFGDLFLAAPRPAPVRHLAGRDPGILPDAGELDEVLLDTEWAGALAPGAQVNVVIGSPAGGLFEALALAVQDRLGDVLTISFGLCEDASVLLAEAFDALYAIANLQGQTVAVASGDFGASDCLAGDPPQFGLGVNGLAASPHAVAVGGTSFALADDGTVPEPLVERVWNDGLFGGGGGESIVFARPQFQVGPGVPAAAGRLLPDVALAADPSIPGYVTVQGGLPGVIGGTSAAAPAFASALALLAEAEGRSGFGQFLPSIYRLGSEQALGLRAPVFRDVTEGSNQVEVSGGFDAGPGFDLASGWGAPLLDAFVGAVGTPGRCEGEIACLVPGSGGRRRSCLGQWLLEHDALATKRGLPLRKQSCRDGDPACDVDGTVNGQCTINVALCLNVFDIRRLDRRNLPACRRSTIRRVKLREPRRGHGGPVAEDNRRSLMTALAGLPEPPSKLRSACTATVPVTVGVAEKRGVQLRAQVRAKGRSSVARVRLSCLPGA